MNDHPSFIVCDCSTFADHVKAIKKKRKPTPPRPQIPVEFKQAEPDRRFSWPRRFTHGL